MSARHLLREILHNDFYHPPWIEFGFPIDKRLQGEHLDIISVAGKWIFHRQHAKETFSAAFQACSPHQEQ